MDSSSDQLASSRQTPPASVPSAFSRNPDGAYLFAAGSESDRLAAYRIEPSTGGLTPLETYAAGKRPMGVLIANLGG